MPGPTNHDPVTIGRRLGRNIPEALGPVRSGAVAASTTIYPGGIAMVNAAGFIGQGQTATGLIGVGRAEALVDNSAGANGDVNANWKPGTYRYDNSAGGDEITAAGATPWFLLNTSRALKPIIFQERRKPQFVSKDKPNDDNVFERKEFLYGADARNNVGFGFWQMAYGSKQALTAANFSAARQAMMELKGDYGRPLGIVRNLLVVPPSLESEAEEILKGEIVRLGNWPAETHVLRGGTPKPRNTNQRAEMVLKRLWRAVRITRNGLLIRHVDNISAVQWDAMNEADKSSVKTYRLALLDVPQNQSDPRAILWPGTPRKGRQ